MSEGDTQESASKDAKPEHMAFADFLESVPPSQNKLIADLLVSDSQHYRLHGPQLTLHCTSEMCNGPRAYRMVGDGPYVTSREPVKNLFVTYLCSNCRRNQKLYSLNVRMVDDGPGGSAYKFGELPAFGPNTPTRLLKLLGDQREHFLKGRRCENQGLGIGAFGYYRRVVEHQKGRIIEEIVKVSEKLGATEETLSRLAEAKAETQFSKSVAMIKDGIPQALLMNGHNPLTLLHNALSAGLHEQTDGVCLELAQSVRVVLVDLSERLSQALKDEAELNLAVSRLLKARP
ncbi:hypothetical protein [Bradyrhizobium sp. 23]|uniref:hypothetical protein n=1 Tax=Bradyrhizobium sp. 23 TaxID=2782667 RepID=UPI001FF84DE2|nr:hypothetical protein [Bradyrhizobium sp. 23]MCK1317149.1 hypothetical protein [Bradyrhizobium sp. 23]